jgi:hypothetical protein
MNYSKHYEALIAKAKARGKPEGYAERHHVVPRSLGGSNSRNNLVWLTAREHFIAHVLLAHVHGGSQWYAVMMFAAGEQRVINSRLYDIAKRKHAIWMSEKFKGVPLSEEHRSRISAGLLGNRNTAGHALSKSHRDAISAALIGNQHTLGVIPGEATRQKMSEAHSGAKHHYFGKRRSSETRAKISAKLSGVKRGPRGPRSEETKARIRAGVLAANAARLNPNPNP